MSEYVGENMDREYQWIWVDKYSWKKAMVWKLVVEDLTPESWVLTGGPLKLCEQSRVWMVWSLVKAIPTRRTYLEATVKVLQVDSRVERERNREFA